MATPKGAITRVHPYRGVHHMFANKNHRLDFADTCAVSLESVLSLAGYGPTEGRDAHEQLAQADAADSQLLRTVMCAALATLVLALVSSMA
jgi:hypothetical protein